MGSVSIRGSEEWTLRSKKTGRRYRLAVGLPHAYRQPPPTEEWSSFFDRPKGGKWPVVYLLDGDFYFRLIVDLVRSMAWCSPTSDAIVVGIGYSKPGAGLDDAWLTAVTRRSTDLTPARDEKFEHDVRPITNEAFTTGGGQAFHDFLKQELIPRIEHDYDADRRRRILAGHSLGGLFAAYALLREPRLFETYLITSPSLQYGERVLFGQYADLARRRKRIRARAFLSAGERELDEDAEILAETLRFANVLEAGKHPGLELKRRVFRDLNHCEVIAPGFHAGLRWALQREPGTT